MSDALQFLWMPLLAAILLTAIHAYLGLHVLARQVIFVDLALAQIAALGASVAFILGYSPQSLATFGYAFVATLCGAALLAWSRRAAIRLPQESIVGIVYIVATALTLIVVDKSPQGAEHVKQMLIGNLLTITPADLLKLFYLYTGAGFAYWLFRRQFHAVSFQGGLSLSWLWDFLFYAFFGLVVTSSVALAGVLVVFSFLIIPAVIGSLFYRDLKRRWLLAWVCGSLASALGLAGSFIWDIPSGAAIVCGFASILILAALSRLLVRATTGYAWRRTARKSAALVLLLSGGWLLLQPQADHPLLDSVEFLWPAFRSVFLRQDEISQLAEAKAGAERYTQAALALNRQEQDSRWQGAALSDESVARLSSYVQSYNEMAKGERFVAQVMRDRARARQVWILGIPAILLGTALWLRTRTRRTAPHLRLEHARHA